MLKRPSSRRKSAQDQIALNLVPILDTMVTLIGFLLFTSSILSIVAIESPAPEVSPQAVEDLIKEKPLQLTLSLSDTEAEIWSPFDKFQAKKIPHESPGHPNLVEIHNALLQIKQQYPTENKIVVVPNAGTTYDTLIAVMDSARSVEASDPPIYYKNPKTGLDEAAKKLFPDVVFGNLLGDS